MTDGAQPPLTECHDKLFFFFFFIGWDFLLSGLPGGMEWLVTEIKTLDGTKSDKNTRHQGS